MRTFQSEIYFHLFRYRLLLYELLTYMFIMKVYFSGTFGIK